MRERGHNYSSDFFSETRRRILGSDCPTKNYQSSEREPREQREELGIKIESSNRQTLTERTNKMNALHISIP